MFWSLSLILGLVHLLSAYPHDSDVKEQQLVVHDREAWQAIPPKYVKDLKTPVPYVIIHHTYIPGACNTTASCSQAMLGMQNYHNSLDWGDIGYNFCVGGDGAAYEGRGWTSLGIHAGPANNFSIGICLIGDFQTGVPPQRQLEATKRLIDQGLSKRIISEDYKLIGHSQAMATVCPGGALLNEISKWKHFSKDNFVNPELHVTKT